MIKKIYTLLSIYFFTTVLFLISINLLSSLYLKNIDTKDESHRMDKMDLASYINSKYTINVDSQYISHVLNDFSANNKQKLSGFQYYPVLEFLHRPYKSKYLNIVKKQDDLVQRITLPVVTTNSKDSLKKIFCFGGSTTFGWNVSDAHTWPSLLKKIMFNGAYTTDVLNYGNAGYTPSQETNQFIELLKLGHRPSLCIFMDGVNTGPVWDGSEYSLIISERFNKYETDNHSNLWTYLNGMPLNKVLDRILKRSIKNNGSILSPIEYSDNKYNKIIASRFIENAKIREAIANIYGIKIIQFLQPSLFAPRDTFFLSSLLDSVEKTDPIVKQMRKNYPAIYSATLKANVGYIDLSGLIKLYQYTPVMDGIHYSPNFNLFISDNILKYINVRDLRPYRFEIKDATGFVFSY